MANDEVVLKGLREGLSLLFLVPEEEITMQTRRDDIPAWDSLQHVNVVLEVETRFGIHLAPEEIENIGGIADILRLVQMHGGLS